MSTGTALGAYAVDYISYDLDRIVAYYEAEVYVYYKRTAEELESIVSVDTGDGLYDAICSALSEMDTSLVAMVGASRRGRGGRPGLCGRGLLLQPARLRGAAGRCGERVYGQRIPAHS